MGNRVPNAGGIGISVGASIRWRLWFGCEHPPKGPALHIACGPGQELSHIERSRLVAALVARDASAVRATLTGSSVAPWWSRVEQSVLRAWPMLPDPVAALWEAPGGTTEWSWAALTTY